MARRFGEFMELLDKKAKPGLMGLQINTNATIFPKPKIMDILKQFRKVDLRLSNESVGELSEYIRNGSKWEDFETNTHKWLEASVGNGIDVKNCTQCLECKQSRKFLQLDTKYWNTCV